MAKYLDSNGITTLWNKIKSTFLTQGGGDERYSLRSHSHSYINSSGIISAISGTSRYESGLRLGRVYVSGYPITYGTTLIMEEGAFGAELIFNGLGGDGATGSGEARFRTHSDWSTSEWGPWRVILDSDNYSSYASPIGHTHPYLPLSGGTLSGDIKATSFIKSGGTSAQFLKADGSIDSNSYASSSHDHSRLGRTTITSTDFTKAQWSGFYNVTADGSTALPGANTGGNVAIHAAWDNGSNTAGLDLLINDSPVSSLYFRSRVGGGGIGAWRTIIDSSNIGSQSVNYATSAGNADTVDGYHYNNLPYLPLSGGTLSGSLSINFSSGYGTYYYGPAEESSIEFFNNGTRKAVFGSFSNCAFIWNNVRANTLRYNDNGTLTFEGNTVWHGGNFNPSNYSTTSHNHDGTYVKSYGTTNDNIDSDWGQSFKTFDPIPSGNPPEQNPNISILSIGDNYIRRKQLAFTYNNDNIYYRRRTDGGWNSWVKLVHSGNIGSQSVSYATSAGSVAWGNVTGKPGTLRVSEAFGFSNDPTGYDYGGLYRNSQITSGGDATTLWLFSYNAIRIEGSSVTINGGTPITSSNIGSQSVNYATSAGNADTVDGFHASGFFRNLGLNPSGITYGSDISTQSVCTLDVGQPDGPANSYNTTWLTLGEYSLPRFKQLAFSYDTDTVGYRRNSGDGWTSWRTFAFLDSNVASATNADTVDGYHYNNLPYLPLSGGTMSGNITMGANGVVFNQSTTSNWNVAANTGIMLLNTVGASATGAPGTYYIGLSVSGYYGFQLATYGGGGTRLLFRNTSRESYPSWSELAFLSDLSWNNISSKPDTATRWPSWSEVTDKPSTFTPSSHSHTNIASLGNKNASDLSSTYPSGLSTSGIYNNGYPFSYGCCMTSMANGGAFQIAGQWNSDVTGESNYDFPTEMYIRGRRDSYDVWTTWTRVVTNRNWSSIISISTLSNSEIDSIIV